MWRSFPVQRASSSPIPTITRSEAYAVSAIRPVKTTSMENRVSKPPKVNPFLFTKSLSEGQSTAVTCTVTQGSKPVQLQWLKDGHEVVGSGAVKLIKHETIVVLSIEPVKVADSGNYTCVARNKYGYDRYTSVLLVNDAPKIQPFQLPARVKAGDKVSATCNLASGTPPVTFSWHKDGSDVTNLSKDISYGSNIMSVIAIPSASLHSQGNYTCRAANVYGSDSHTVQLKVEMPPVWTVEPGDAFGTIGGMLNLTCLASGSPEPTITWKQLTDNKHTSQSAASVTPTPTMWRQKSVRWASPLQSEEDMSAFMRRLAGKHEPSLD
ncbi:hypothetical protein HPB50_015410 [Hyalomma asiaticum]|uniref:Uncharacterized protein n=1 Tax=Hyalomma asiaticum TaxID=266040 RepID=A0ACB7S1M6_HYAAI|nr:hypothetical protein HPB50_015410 [Hyalomma asiaticum]